MARSPRQNEIVLDGAIFLASFAAAFLIRFEGIPDWGVAKQFLLWLPWLLAYRLLVNWRLGVYRLVWRYVSLPDVLVIGRSLAVVTAFLLGLRLFYPGWAMWAWWLRLPLSVIALEFLLSLTGSLGARVLERILFEWGVRLVHQPLKRPRRVILYGAGRSGVLLSRELRAQPGIQVLGFVDDNTEKVGTAIFGTKVLGTGKSLARLVRQLHIDDVIVSMSAASPKTLTDILARCEQVGIPAKIIPTIEEMVRENLSISHLRELRFEDLLERDGFEVPEFDQELRQTYGGKRVLVTGAGGSIGRELVRQLLRLGPHCVAFLDKDENSVYELEQEVAFKFPDIRTEPQIADLRHRERIQAFFADFKPQIVFHAAAHKHVPLMERHPCEAVLNNVLGTRTLLEVCCENGVERFVFISTDKAVNPTSVLGGTKRAGELLVQAFARNGFPASACVRFGNVMGSRGSVIPLFQRQIAAGGPITVTHPEVVRFFMTIPEAVQLVLCAGTLGERGEVFVLDMGNPRKILDLAHKIVRLCGLVPGKDIEIAITGLRPGEKLVEELVAQNERLSATRFEKLSRVVSPPRDGDAVFTGVAELVSAAHRSDADQIYTILLGMDLGFHPQHLEVREPRLAEL